MSLQTRIAIELERLIAYRPVNGHFQQVSLLFDYLESELRTTGLKLRRGKYEGYEYILAGTKSINRSRILLQAHVDVVPAEPSQFRLQHAAGKLLGRGAYDMLFATAVYLVLLRELQATKQLAELDLGVMLTSDEENGGFRGVGHLIKQYKCDVCFLPDAGSITAACVSSKGVLLLEATSAGVAGHSSQPDSYRNPILPLAALVTELQRSYPNSNTSATTCAITQFFSGGAINQVPHAARATIDIRFPADGDVSKIFASIRHLAKPYNVTLQRLAYAAPYTADMNNPYFQAFIQCYQQVTGSSLGEQPNLGNSDARFFAEKNIPVIMIRPDGGDIHGEHEWVSAESLKSFYTIVKTYITKEA